MDPTSNQPDNECPFKRSIPVQRSLRLSLSVATAAALALASTPIQPIAAQDDDSAADLGVMESIFI